MAFLPTPLLRLPSSRRLPPSSPPPWACAISITPIRRVHAPAGAAGHRLRLSPLARRTGHFVDDDAILASLLVKTSAASPDAGASLADSRAYLRAGPRRHVFFGETARAVVVTCGGIAPGLATVVREVVMCMVCVAREGRRVGRRVGRLCF